MSHDNHHFVPEFLLKQWHTGADQKLTSMRWSKGRIWATRFKAHSVAKQRHLYSAISDDGDPDNALETNFITPEVDGPGAAAHNVLLTSGIDALTAKQRSDWTRFLVCQLVRYPKKLEHLRRQGREILMEAAEPVAGTDDAAISVAQWVAKNAPSLFDNLAILTLPSIVKSHVLNQVFLRARWYVADVRRSDVDLVLSDNPLNYEGQMNGRFLFSLPLSPRVLFCAFDAELTGRNLQSAKARDLVRATNKGTVDQASTYVYATDSKQLRLVERYLRRPQERSPH